jgi:CRISPR-associated protein Csb2
MLALRVEYLTGVCMATRHNDPTRSVPEWPPHPDRLYSAMVAAAAEPSGSDGTNLPERARAALKWLAEQGAPQLHASPAHRRTTPDVPLPSNPAPDEIPRSLEPGPRAKDPAKARKKLEDGVRNLLPMHRKKALLPIPAVIPDEPVVFFMWPHAEPDGHLKTLREICERVAYLGRSRSLVRVSVEQTAPPATFVPDPAGSFQLRVPDDDRLAYLIEKYERDGGKPEPSTPIRYRQIDGSPGRAGRPRTVFERFWILQPRAGDPGLPIEATTNLTRSLRRAVLEQIHAEACGCGRWNGGVPNCREALECYARIPGTLSGHAPDCGPLQSPHLAFVALPFVHPMQRHADGAVKGVSVIIPRGLDPDSLSLLARALVGLERDGLRVPHVGLWRLREVAPDDPPLSTLDSRTWTAASPAWTTATPMVFGHHPKPQNGGEAKVVLDALRLVGIDAARVVEVAVSRHSPLHGAPPSWRFKVRGAAEGRANSQRLIRHVTVRFDRPVVGPILLGAQRYFGLGLMRPWEI